MHVDNPTTRNPVIDEPIITSHAINNLNAWDNTRCLSDFMDLSESIEIKHSNIKRQRITCLSISS